MNDYTKPVWQLNGKDYKTVNGLITALLKKHPAACSASGVRKDNTLAVSARNADGSWNDVAIYKVGAPEIGKPMIVSAS